MYIILDKIITINNWTLAWLYASIIHSDQTSFIFNLKVIDCDRLHLKNNYFSCGLKSIQEITLKVL